jgi:protein-S-isoprenylcysteine O-methyltransferase Ste14
MRAPYWVVISWCWIVFWVYWTLGARRKHASRRQATLAFTILNTAVLYVGLILVLSGLFDVGVLSFQFANAAVWVNVVGTALVLAGVALAIWSRRVLGANWSGVVRIVEGQHLVRSGPYRVVRNPIYSGIVLAVLGAALVRGTVGALAGVVLVVLALWLKGRMEERFLVVEFGEEYAAYQREVKFLIPFVF